LDSPNKGTRQNIKKNMQVVQRILAIIAMAFGVMTVVAGARVLGGSDPGYVVFRPLLIFNTVMGAAYIAAGIVMWRSIHRGKLVAASIAVLNLLMLGTVTYLYTSGSPVAIDSVRAMILRTGVWLLLFAGMAWFAGRLSAAKTN